MRLFSAMQPVVRLLPPLFPPLFKRWILLKDPLSLSLPLSLAIRFTYIHISRTELPEKMSTINQLYNYKITVSRCSRNIPIYVLRTRIILIKHLIIGRTEYRISIGNCKLRIPEKEQNINDSLFFLDIIQLLHIRGWPCVYIVCAWIIYSG